MAKNDSQDVQVQVDPVLARPIFSNLVQIGHTSTDFFLDFIAIVGGAGTLCSRIALTPEHCKRLAVALQENIDSYEKAFGEVIIRKD